MEGTPSKLRVPWYRCHVSREDLKRFNQRSDLLGFAQTAGFLGVLASTATASIYSAYHWPWWVTVPIVFLHGMCWPFLINGFHELVHDSVFRTRWLNWFFLRVFSFLGWYNHHWFWASHTEHHKYTLHPPDDLEVVLPMKLTLWGFFQSAIINPRGLYNTIRNTIRNACGIVDGQWSHQLFDKEPQRLAKLRNWAIILLVGHSAIVAVSIYMHWWMVPVVITLGPYYGGWLQSLCNSAQHAGLQDNVADFRLCCRTIYLNPVIQFMYWHMNYHTEHHMFAAVPCYHLGQLHRAIKPEMPHCPNGLYETWKQIGWIVQKQKEDPRFQYAPELPPRVARKRPDDPVQSPANPSDNTVPAGGV